MKKVLSIFLIVSMLVTMGVSCGKASKSDGGTKGSKPEVSSVTDEGKDSKEGEDSSFMGNSEVDLDKSVYEFKDMEDLTSSKYLKEAVASLNSQYESSGIAVAITAEGKDTLVVNCKMPVEYEILKGMVEEMDTALEAQSDTLCDALKVLTKTVKEDNLKLKVVFSASNAKEVYSKDYKLEG